MNTNLVWLVLAIVVVSFIGIISYSTKDTVTLTVSDKERITNYDGDNYYLVFTDEGEVFKNQDTMWMFKFDSSSVQGQLKKGSTYTCDVNWFRFGLTSSYRNILDCEN